MSKDAPPLGNSRHVIPEADLSTLDNELGDRVRIAQTQTAGAKAVFGVLANHPRLLDKWLKFAGHLLVRGSLPRRHAELLILRTAWNCACDYEWTQHVALGREFGLDEGDFETLAGRTLLADRPELDRLLIVAADQLHESCRIGDRVWNALSVHLDSQQLIELCLLVGQYQMLAMLINSAGVQTETRPEQDDGARPVPG